MTRYYFSKICLSNKLRENILGNINYGIREFARNNTTLNPTLNSNMLHEQMNRKLRANMILMKHTL